MSDFVCYHVVDCERQKWEARESQLLELLHSHVWLDEVHGMVVDMIIRVPIAM